ncbi:MAG: cytochrome c [Acidobacteriota bacterium]|nr:cytochrome c [Acidobacteriota bacterium]
MRAQNTPAAPRANSAAAPQFPDAPGKEVVQKLCNTCHGAEVTISKGRTRAQWGEVIASMVTRGAKGTDQEFAQVLGYLANNFPPDAGAAGQTAAAGTNARRRQTPGAGPMDVQVVDAAAADRGKSVYIAECITCHGQRARGKDDAADLVRSLVVLHDRYGSTLGPFLKSGHPMQSGRLSASLNQGQVGDLAHFLHQRVADTLRSGPYSKVINVLTGDAKAGAAYFSGAGKCISCHSVTGDLARVGAKYDPPALQQRFLFPRGVGFVRGGGVAHTKPVMVTVIPPSGAPVTGVLDKLDDFNVSLRDAAGDYHSFTRTPELKVEKKDPYQAHYDLLELYTDRNIHDVVAYLASLK